MKIEVEFCKSETAILEAAFEQHRDELREHWAVDTMADMVKLLAMHGLDSLEGILDPQPVLHPYRGHAPMFWHGRMPGASF